MNIAEISPVEMTDIVLHWISREDPGAPPALLPPGPLRDHRPSRAGLSYQQIKVGVALEHPKLNIYKHGKEFQAMLPLILQHLEDENYISVTKFSNAGATCNVYAQNLKGIMFSKDGGYTNVLKMDRKKTKIRAVRDWSLIIGSVAATVVAFVLLIHN